MKNQITIILVFVSLITMSCEHVIDVDLNDSKPQLVVEAVLNDTLAGNFVKISRSKNYYEPNNFDKISGADVKMWDQQGTLFQLSEVAPGLYAHPTLSGDYDKTYQLQVNMAGRIITSTAYMNSKAQLDSLTVEENISSFAEGGDYRVRVYFTDPVGVENYYQMKIYRNGEKEELTALLDDGIFDGKSTSFPIFFYGYDIGEEVTIDLISIDEKMFRYLTVLAENADGSLFSAAPGNPPSDFNDEEVLGYFGAFSVARESIVIQ